MTGSVLRTGRRCASGTVRQSQRSDLPVAARPAVLARRERQVVRRVVVDQMDVGAQSGARVRPFEQVVAQERVLGHAVLQRRLEGVDVVDALADVAAFVKEILVDVRDRRRVRIDADVPGEHLRERRTRWR